MKFLAVGDVVDPESLLKLLDIDLESYLFLLLTGDMSGSPEGWKIGRARTLGDKSFIPLGRDPKGFYEELLRPSVRKLREVDLCLKKLQKRVKIFAVYGNADFRSVVDEVRPSSYVVLHKRLENVGGMELVGYNGHPMYYWEIERPYEEDIFGYTSAETAEEINSFREEDIYRDLKNLSSGKSSDRLIVLTHTPPYEILDKVKPEFVQWAVASYGSSAKAGNVGSTGLRKFILECKPLLSIFGHIHESKGIENVKGTTCINVGAFGEDGEFLDVEIGDGEPRCSFRGIDS
jgi:Icc-related predicted phosphoesterase